jgi:hypothetical protein
MAEKVAALFVEQGGVYYGLPDVEPWGPPRDAREYSGPNPVVAHPPCGRWSHSLAPLNERRYGHRVGDDGGCFESALGSVRRWGGVLEHPAVSIAWPTFGLTKPQRGVWTKCMDGGWVTEVSQAAYGHPARKLTWLYAFGVEPRGLDWSRPSPSARVSWMERKPGMRCITKAEAAATPPAFRDELIAIAASAAACPTKT